MAHSQKLRTALRKTYISDRVPLTTCAAKHKVSVATAQNWKNKAKQSGDDWDKERDAFDVSSMGLEDAAALMLRQHIRHHNAVMEMLDLPRGDEGAIADPMDRVKALSTAADSYAKMLSSHRKHSPSISELSTALDVVRFLTDYLEKENPDLLIEFVDVLEPFGMELSKRYG